MTGTVRQNIALGAHHPSDERVVEVAQIAGVHDFISVHPDGYNLKLGERGEGLSGGQRQAITIARALVGQPPILLLDEPTSAMDINTERQLIERLKPAIGRSTLLVITHKATLLELVDRVIVLDQGKVVADGPRDKVLGAGGPQGSGPGGPAPAPAGPKGPVSDPGPGGIGPHAQGSLPSPAEDRRAAAGSDPALGPANRRAASGAGDAPGMRAALSARPFGVQAAPGALEVVVPPVAGSK